MTQRNLHLDHIDESHFIDGQLGAENAMESLQSLIDGYDNVFVTEKWDGAPAIFVGTDPSDGKFFIATKSVFNKTPVLYKEASAIIDNEPEGKAIKLMEAFAYLKGLNIPKDSVLQGDLLWSNRADQKYRTYENKRYVTVHPNTLIYGWETNTPEALQVESAKVGVVFHTTYRGEGDLQSYTATFGADVSTLRETRDVWVRDASYNSPSLSEEHREMITHIIDRAESVAYDFNSVAAIMNMIPEAFAGARIQSFYNSQIRQGIYPYDVKAYFKHVQDYYAKQMDKVKTDAAKDKRKVQLKQLLDMMKGKEQHFYDAFYYTYKINEAKLAIIDELNSRNKQKVFVEENGQLHKAKPEGYVVVDRITGHGVKLVDRQEFSYMNFNESVTKGWMK